MRKLISVSASLFLLGFALLSKPAVALSQCDCGGYCSFRPNSWCLTADGLGMYVCSEYILLECS